MCQEAVSSANVLVLSSSAAATAAAVSMQVAYVGLPLAPSATWASISAACVDHAIEQLHEQHAPLLLSTPPVVWLRDPS